MLFPILFRVDKKGYMFYALYMPAIEELEQRIARLETLYEDVLLDDAVTKLNHLTSVIPACRESFLKHGKIPNKSE